MDTEHPIEPQREFRAEHIAGRKDWVRYVELKTALYRAHVSRIEDELAPIVDDLLRHDVHRSERGPQAGPNRNAAAAARFDG